MSQGFGREVPQPHVQPTHRQVTKYLVVVPCADGPVARLFLESREQVAELDANTEEVTTMIKGVAPSIGATGPEWDGPLAGHSAEERAAAAVYALAL
jgi:hypothetical protein